MGIFFGISHGISWGILGLMGYDGEMVVNGCWWDVEISWKIMGDIINEMIFGRVRKMAQPNENILVENMMTNWWILFSQSCTMGSTNDAFMWAPVFNPEAFICGDTVSPLFVFCHISFWPHNGAMQHGSEM